MGGAKVVQLIRDHNGERGAVPTDYRAHDWQTCRLLRELAESWSRDFARWRRVEWRGRDAVAR